MKMAFVALIPFLFLTPQDPKTLSVTYQNGEKSNVQVLELDGDKVRLRVLVLGGHMTITRKLSEFVPMSTFRILQEGTQPDSYDEHFALAKRAIDLGLLTQAGAQARDALKLVEGKPEAAAKESELRAWAAGALEKMLKDALAAEDLKDAKHILKILSTRLNDQCTEEQLDALAASVEELDDKVQAGKAAERQARLDQKVAADIEKRLRPIYNAIEKGDDIQREAISKSKNTSQSAKLAKRSIDAYEAAWKRTEALVKKYPDENELRTEADAIGKHLHSAAIRSALHAANVLTVQSDYKGAMSWVEKVLAFDPGNDEAKQMRTTIQQASAAGWGWGWGVGRPGR